MAITTPNRAHASPTKGFFVYMITRDITFDDSIMDLIDNSLDGAWRQQGHKPIGLNAGPNLSQYKICIHTSPERFTIRDNCGGMTLDQAARHAFSFGRQAEQGRDPYSIGIYGIGMKRAAFKLGADARIRSTYEDTDKTRRGFVVPIIVEEWLKNDSLPWDFPISEDACMEENGVEISIRKLTDGAKSCFRNETFIQNLRRAIARDYMLPLNRGLTISVNDAPVKGAQIKLRKSNEYLPMRVEYETRVEKDRVKVEIIGGMAAPPEQANADEDREGDRSFGWYVVCNGRIVLAADKTTVSGWGTDGWPQWHSQYYGFIGFVLFTARNAAVLPLTTTKRNVDTSSEVFLQARQKMREASKGWIAYTNERKQALDEARQKERVATAVPIRSLERRDTVGLPSLTRRPPGRVANVNYSVPLRRMNKLRQGLREPETSYREVGLKTFDYTYEDVVGEE